VVRLPASAVEIVLHQDDTFTAKFSDLLEHVKHPECRVSIAVGAGGTSRTYDFGTVSDLSPPLDRSFEGLDADKPRVYRLMVWDHESKRVVASNERLQARDSTIPAEREPLLPVRPAALGGLVWKLALHADTAPELLVNSSIPKLKTRLAKKPELRGSIVPEATRQCLMHVYDYREFDDGDPSAWQSKWLRFADTFAARPEDWGPDLDRDEARAWADEVVDSLSKEHDFAKWLTAEWGDENDND